MADLTREQIEACLATFPDPPEWVSAMDEDAQEAFVRNVFVMALRALDPGWRSMESAPRDGTRILVVRDYGNDLFTDTAKLHKSDVIPHLIAWMPLPPPFTGDTGKRGEHA